MKALEKVFIWVMYTAIVGSAVYFATQLKQIEATIAQHHGQGWAELKNIVQTSQIQAEVSGARETLSNQIVTSKSELENLLVQHEREIQQLSARIRSLELWTQQGDAIMTERDKRKFKGHALYTDDGSNESLCTVNFAHPDGRFFKVNDRVSVINSDSHREETTQCVVSATANDMDQPTVLFTLNKETASHLGFSKEIGRIAIFASLADIPEERRWKMLSEYRGPRYYNEKDFINPFAALPVPAAGINN